MLFFTNSRPISLLCMQGEADIVVEFNSTLAAGSSPMNFTSASVVYVGAALNTSLAVGDVTNSTDSTPLITLLDRVCFTYHKTIPNMFLSL